MASYGISYWDIPQGSLCPPIPGRADYIHYLADLLKATNNNKIPHKETIKALDIGTGANCIYPIIGVSQYNWDFVGSDIYLPSVNSANNIVTRNEQLKTHVEIRQQNNSNAIFTGIIKANETYDLTLCNPPFHRSQQEANKGTERKWKNLNKEVKNNNLNFGGISNELWCDGGELSFITKMINESVLFSSQVLWFTCLVSKKDHIRLLKLALKKKNCPNINVIKMEQGQKTSRFIAWSFMSDAKIKQWCIDRFNK